MSLIKNILYKKIGNHQLVEHLLTGLTCGLLVGPTLGCIAGTVAGACYVAQSKKALEEFSNTSYCQSQIAEEDISLSNLETLLHEEEIKLETANRQLNNGEISPSEYSIVYENYVNFKNNYEELYMYCTSPSRSGKIIQKYIKSVEAGEMIETDESTERIVAEYKNAEDSVNVAGWTTCGLACAIIPAGVVAYNIPRSDLLESLPYDSSY